LSLVSEFYPNGNTSFTYHISNDSIRNGIATSYFKNEKIANRYNYVNGYIDGEVEYFDSLTSRLIAKRFYQSDTLKYYELYDSTGTIRESFKYLLEEDLPEFDSSFVILSTSESILIEGDTVTMRIDIPGVPMRQVTPIISNGAIWLKSKDEFQFRVGQAGTCELTFMVNLNDDLRKQIGSLKYEVASKN